MTEDAPPVKSKLQLLAVFVIAAVAALFAQGPLTPPGAPAPTMKTLAQIEARTPIAGPGAVTISASGSYYLTTNINVATGDAITITADNVTLDLNGFTISSTAPVPGSGTAILLSGGRGLDAGIANSCEGYSSSGIGLSADIANSCRGGTTSGTARSINYKYNMPF